jgi:hypothetical protein
MQVGDPSYRTVKGILAAGSEAAPEPEATGSDTPAYLRGAQGIVGSVDAVVATAESIIAAEQALLDAGTVGEVTS